MFLRGDDMLKDSCTHALLHVMVWSRFPAPSSRTTGDQGQLKFSGKIHVVGNLALNHNVRLWKASC